ncbi:hypothetical protein Salat_0247200 [Sesamum alatum]|uniref:Uncharacterized protein n=1 Tax=Sesamum alatum TaxID=300844 RepID=A0AAE1YZ34_9LAMI|nr:hypothetical protein Salat_0247200 [Sesamum alatum]
MGETVMPLPEMGATAWVQPTASPQIAPSPPNLDDVAVAKTKFGRRVFKSLTTQHLDSARLKEKPKKLQSEVHFLEQSSSLTGPVPLVYLLMKWSTPPNLYYLMSTFVLQDVSLGGAQLLLHPISPFGDGQATHCLSSQSPKLPHLSGNWHSSPESLGKSVKVSSLS